jgi:hypothetical protein
MDTPRIKSRAFGSANQRWAAAAARFLEAAPDLAASGARHTKKGPALVGGGAHEATPVHGFARRRGGGVAARSARAAAGEAADDRLWGRPRVSLELLSSRIRRMPRNRAQALNVDGHRFRRV